MEIVVLRYKIEMVGEGSASRELLLVLIEILIMWAKLVLNSQSSCLGLLGPGIIGLPHYSFMQCRVLNPCLHLCQSS